MAIVGLMMYSIIIGSASSALANMDSTATQRRQTLDKVTAFMRSRKVPSFFQRIIIDFYEHMWSTPNKEADVFADLPDSLRSRLMIVMNRDLIDRIPIFQYMPANVYIRMVQRLQHATFLPGEFVARYGEESRDIYFIKRGRVDSILPSGGSEVFMTLRPGEYFGQHGVIYNLRRTCHYRAVDFLDVLGMGREDLDELSITSPAFTKELKRVDALRQRRRLELELERVREEEKLSRDTLLSGKMARKSALFGKRKHAMEVTSRRNQVNLLKKLQTSRENASKTGRARKV